MTGVHKSAQQGFSTQAVTYAQGRPDYPRQLTGWLADTLRINAQSSVIDLGAGTGKFTRLLSTLAPTLTAVEPVAAMGAQLTKLLPDVRLVNGTAESIPLPSASTDAVVCAQAFHWFSTEAALAEIHRVLKPDGRLGLVWNVRDESVDLGSTTLVLAFLFRELFRHVRVELDHGRVFKSYGRVVVVGGEILQLGAHNLAQDFGFVVDMVPQRTDHNVVHQGHTHGCHVNQCAFVDNPFDWRQRSNRRIDIRADIGPFSPAEHPDNSSECERHRVWSRHFLE